MDTPESSDQQASNHSLSEGAVASAGHTNAKTVSASEIGIGIACAAGVSYVLTRKRKPRATPVRDATPARKINQEDPISLPHQTILFLKLLLPVLLASDADVKTKKSASDPQEVVEVPGQYHKSPAPDIAIITEGNRYRQAWQLSKAAVNAWLDDFAPSMGAAIAYYTIFSIAPMLVIAIAVAGFIFGQDAAQGEIVAQLRSVIGVDGAVAIQGLLKSASEPAAGIIATVISVITLAVGSTAVFAELQSALDRIWRVPVAVKENGIWALLRTRLLSFGLILGLGFMLMVSLVVSAGLAALGVWWGTWFEGWEVVLQILNLAISFFVFAGLFSVIYKFMPRVRLSWRDVWVGAVATSALFIIGKYLIGLYLGTTGMTTGFGAAGSFALLLAWVYYSAQIFLLGAEFTWIYANNFGSRKRAP